MRRQKRDMSDRAFQRGYQAGVSGRSSDTCPHTNEIQRQSWLTGWHEGRCDQWDGYTGVSALHKMQG
jgi:ribosome modulation factor